MLIGQLWLTQSQKCEILAIIVHSNNTFSFWAVHMGVWVTWLMFGTSEHAKWIDARIKPLSSKTLFLFTNICKLKWTCPYILLHTFAYFYILLHTFAYFCILLHTFTYFYIILHTFAYICILLHTFAYFYILLHTFAYFCILLYTFVYFCILLHNFTYFIILLYTFTYL